MIFSILAIDKNNLIGKKNKLPWHYPLDLKHFKEKTFNKNVLMGLSTYTSLTEDYNFDLSYFKEVYVASKDIVFKNDNAKLVSDGSDFLKTFADDLFIIGGKTLFEETLSSSDLVYLTKINKEYTGDVYLDFDFSEFKKIKEKQNDELTFLTLIKKTIPIFNIKEIYLKVILNKEKTFEFRLNTPDRSKIKMSSLVCLKSDSQTLIAKIGKILHYKNWEMALEKHFDTDFNYCFKNQNEALLELSKYYTHADIQKYGLVAYELTEVKNV